MEQVRVIGVSRSNHLVHIYLSGGFGIVISDPNFDELFPPLSACPTLDDDLGVEGLGTTWARFRWNGRAFTWSGSRWTEA